MFGLEGVFVPLNLLVFQNGLFIYLCVSVICRRKIGHSTCQCIEIEVLWNGIHIKRLEQLLYAERLEQASVKLI